MEGEFINSKDLISHFHIWLNQINPELVKNLIKVQPKSDNDDLSLEISENNLFAIENIKLVKQQIANYYRWEKIPLMIFL